MKDKAYSHGGNRREVEERYGLPPNKILDFSASISPWTDSLRIEEIVKDNLESIYHYPDPECRELVRQISQYLAVDTENILAGNGSTELIYLAARTLSPRRALILSPTFFEYERALRIGGGEPKFLFLRESQGFSLNVQTIIDETKDVEAVFICNPNNPTGTFLTKDELIELVKMTEERKIALILDESYIDFKYPGETLASEAPKAHSLLVLRSFTKFFGIAGLRLGYGVGGTHLIEKMAGLKEPWAVNSLAQAIGISLLRNEESMKKIREAASGESEFLFGELSRMRGLKPYPPEANFILVKIETGISSMKLREDLARRGILIRDCGNFTGLSDKFFRIASRKREENSRLIEVLRETVQGGSEDPGSSRREGTHAPD